MKDILEGVSPRPWAFEPHNLYGAKDEYPFGYVSSKPHGVATPLFSIAPVLRLDHAQNAAFIVHAVNTYEAREALIAELVQALEVCVEHNEGCFINHYSFHCEEPSVPEYISNARATLTRAKEVMKG